MAEVHILEESIWDNRKSIRVFEDRDDALSFVKRYWRGRVAWTPVAIESHWVNPKVEGHNLILHTKQVRPRTKARAKRKTKPRHCVATVVCKVQKAEMTLLNGNWQCQTCCAIEVRP